MSHVKSQLLHIPGVSRLTLKDEPLFRIAFPNESTFYAHSWMYVLRASHLYGGKLGYKFFNHDLVAVIGQRNGFIYVTPILDTTRGVRLRQLCDDITKETGQQIILKKVPPSILTSEITLSSRQHSELPLEDDSLGETVLHLEKLFMDEKGTLNPIAKRVARKVRAFEKHGQTLTVTETMKDVPAEAIEEFLSQWPSKYDSYMPMVRYMRSQKKLPHRYRIMVFTHEEAVKAIYIAEKISLTEMGLYCGVTSKDEAGITEWMDIYFFSTLLKEGSKLVYLGGSEREGIAHFCDKLLPYKPSYVVQAMLYQPLGATSLKIDVRLMTETDITPLASVYRRAYNAMDLLGERWTRESAHKFISHFYRRQPDLFFTAEIEGKLIGGAVAAIQPWWDGNHLVEGEVFIDPSYKDKAIEQELLKKLLVTARKTYHVVAWDTLMPTVGEHTFSAYESIGFNEMPYRRAISADMTTMLARLGE